MSLNKHMIYEPSEDDVKFMSNVMVQVTKVVEAVAKTVRTDLINGKYDEFIKQALIDTLNEE